MERDQVYNVKKSFRGYIYTLGLLSLIIILTGGAVFAVFLRDHFLWVYPFVVLYFFLLNAFQHFSLLDVSVNNLRLFQANYLMWFGAKLFLNLTFVLVYILTDKIHALSFVLVFGLCYIVYGIFEVASLTNVLRGINSK